jgi:predicted MPP superfamily phosphohydrolase
MKRARRIAAAALVIATGLGLWAFALEPASLTHNPDLFPTLSGRFSLLIAGHTHGGQVRVPLLGRPIVPSTYGQRFAFGHVVEGGAPYVRQSGAGNEHPSRTIPGPARNHAAGASPGLGVKRDG